MGNTAITEGKEGSPLPSTEPVIRCPKCHTDIKLTESLAAPLLEATRQDYEAKLAKKDAEAQKREQSVREKEAALAQDRDAFDKQIADRLQQERSKIAADEAKKARLALDTDIQEKQKQLTDLQEVFWFSRNWRNRIAALSAPRW